MTKYFLLFSIALAFSLALTPVVRALASWVGAIDLPDKRKIHSKPIPRLGGVAIFLAFNISVLIAATTPFFSFSSYVLKGVRLEWLFVIALLFLAMGAVDDIRRIGALTKLLFQVIGGLIFALTCTRIEVVSLPFATIHMGVMAIPVTVFWVVAITNAINLLDGLDGLAGGTGLIVCAVIFGISILGQNIPVALISVALAGSILGFLKYNFNPASIFLGDSGSYFLGFTLSALSLMGSFKGTTTVALLIPILSLGVPLMDTFVSTLRRLLKAFHIVEIDRRKKKIRFLFSEAGSVFQADSDHIHHRLLRMGLTQKKAVSILYSISFVLGLTAFASVYFQSMNYALLLIVIGIATFFSLGKLGYKVHPFKDGFLLPLYDVSPINLGFVKILVELAFMGISYYFAFLIKYEGVFNLPEKEYFLRTAPLVLAVKMAVFLGFKMFQGHWRHAGIEGVIAIIKAVLVGSIVSGFSLWIIPSLGIRSWSVLIIDFLLLLFLILAERCSFQMLEHLYYSQNGKSSLKNLPSPTALSHQEGGGDS